MTIIQQYISKTIISTILLVMLLLTGVELFIEFTREFPDMGNGYYGLTQVFSYVPMVLPSNIYKLFPMAGLLGCILGLGLLASHNELIVMRISGISIIKITNAVIKASLAIILIMLIIGEIFAPKLQSKASINKTEAMSNGQTLLTHQGLWTRENNNFIHIAKVLSNGRVEGITRYVFNEKNQLEYASFARVGIFKDGNWLFSDVVQTNFYNQNNTLRTNNQHFENQTWGMKLKPRLLGLTSNDVDQKSLPELYSYILYQKQSGLNTKNYEFVFWQRIFQPIATLVMIVLAVPFVFGPLRSATMGLRMLAGIITGFSFYILNQFVGPFSIVYQVPPIIAATLPTLIFALLGSVMLLRVKR